MKNSLHIIAAIVMVTLLAACAEKLPQQESDASSVPFRIDVSIPETVLSKSPVSGAEGIFGIQLVCFDANSLFVGLGAATRYFRKHCWFRAGEYYMHPFHCQRRTDSGRWLEVHVRDGSYREPVLG